VNIVILNFRFLQRPHKSEVVETSLLTGANIWVTPYKFIITRTTTATVSNQIYRGIKPQ